MQVGVKGKTNHKHDDFEGSRILTHYCVAIGFQNSKGRPSFLVGFALGAFCFPFLCAAVWSKLFGQV